MENSKYLPDIKSSLHSYLNSSHQVLSVSKKMEEINPEINPYRNSKSISNLWQKAKIWFVVSSMLGLGTLNILSLVNEKVHDAGYGVVKAVLSSVVTDETKSRLLSGSPTVRRKSDVAFATKALSEEKSILAASKRALEVENTSLGKINQEIKGKHAELARISAIRSTTAQKISKRLAIRSIVNATRNTSSVLAEAIPVAGVAIVVGVTALDIHDACENLKDMNELNVVFNHTQEDQTKVCGMKVPTRDEAMAQAKSSWNATYQTAADALKKGEAAVASGMRK